MNKISTRKEIDMTKGGQIKISNDRLDESARKYGVVGRDKDRYMKNRGWQPKNKRGNF